MLHATLAVCVFGTNLPAREVCRFLRHRERVADGHLAHTELLLQLFGIRFGQRSPGLAWSEILAELSHRHNTAMLAIDIIQRSPTVIVTAFVSRSCRDSNQSKQAKIFLACLLKDAGLLMETETLLFQSMDIPRNKCGIRLGGMTALLCCRPRIDTVCKSPCGCWWSRSDHRADIHSTITRDSSRPHLACRGTLIAQQRVVNSYVLVYKAYERGG